MRRYEIMFIDNYTNIYQGPYITMAASLDEAMTRFHERFGPVEIQIANLKIDGEWQDVTQLEY